MRSPRQIEARRSAVKISEDDRKKALAFALECERAEKLAQAGTLNDVPESERGSLK